MARKILLSIDGGGIRGIIPLCALIELEKQLGKPARDVFAFMAGTSTGAIIAGALASGISAKRTLEVYLSLGAKVFVKDYVGFITSLGSYRYRTRPLADLLKQFFGESVLNDLPIDIMITATRVRDGRAFYFVRDNPNNSQTTGKVRLFDCVAASSAAPTYFQPRDVPGFGACVDGGVGIAGNPSYQMCVTAFEYTGGAYLPADSTIVALGTGYYRADHTPTNLVAWIEWTVGELLHDPSEQQTELIQRHYVPMGARLIRVNPQLPKSIGLDNFSAADELVQIGTQTASQMDWAVLLDERSYTSVLDANRLPRNQP